MTRENNGPIRCDNASSNRLDCALDRWNKSPIANSPFYEPYYLDTMHARSSSFCSNLQLLTSRNGLRIISQHFAPIFEEIFLKNTVNLSTYLV